MLPAMADVRRCGPRTPTLEDFFEGAIVDLVQMEKRGRAQAGGVVHEDIDVTQEVEGERCDAL
jgi:hypothetical protein